MISEYAEVDPLGNVVNIVLWDGVAPFNVAPNTLVSAAGQPNAQPGGTYLNGTFTAPAAPAAAQGIIFAQVPTAGGTVNLPNAPQPQAKLFAILSPAGAISGLTINAPPSPNDGDDLYLLSIGFAISNCVFTPPAGTGKINIPATFTLAAGVSAHIAYSAQEQAWFRL